MPTGAPTPLIVGITNVPNVTVDLDKHDGRALSSEGIQRTLGDGHTTQLKDTTCEPSDSQGETEFCQSSKSRSRVHTSDFTSVRIPTYHHL
jgi:hypothetical protein